MCTHEQHIVMETDEHFETGTFAHLVIGNEGRVLDGRRTPGYIEQYDEQSAMFVWRITAFEDKGKCWEIPAEEISSYQFRKGCSLLSRDEADKISKQCKTLNQTLYISKDETAFAETEQNITCWEKVACEWIGRNSTFIKAGCKFDFSSEAGNELLFDDLESYLKAYDLLEMERITAEQYLLNPYSGEWIKAMKIVMAEMGMIVYKGPKLRKKDTLIGIGGKENREKYILARMGFVRSVFKMCACSEVPVFRGMSSPIDFYETPQTLISTTFSVKTAIDFADMKQSSTSRSAYVVKYTCPVEKLFMTFLETRQFNERYKEQEAIVIYDGRIKF